MQGLEDKTALYAVVAVNAPVDNVFVVPVAVAKVPTTPAVTVAFCQTMVPEDPFNVNVEEPPEQIVETDAEIVPAIGALDVVIAKTLVVALVAHTPLLIIALYEVLPVMFENV